MKSFPNYPNNIGLISLRISYCTGLLWSNSDVLVYLNPSDLNSSQYYKETFVSLGFSFTIMRFLFIPQKKNIQSWSKLIKKVNYLHHSFQFDSSTQYLQLVLSTIVSNRPKLSEKNMIENRLEKVCSCFGVVH